MSLRAFSNSVLLSDFDHTIVTTDTGEFTLNHFGDPKWKQMEEEYENGKITFEESLRREFGTIKVPQREILEELEKVVIIRPHFAELVEYCKVHHLPFTVVSGGLDFCIRHFLNRTGWLNFVEIYAATTRYTPEGYRLTFPAFFDKGSVNFKQDLVRHHRGLGRKVYYVGDGLGDYPAAREADFPFAIKGSKLAESCRAGNIRCEEVTDFQEVIEAIDKLYNSESS